MTIPARIFSRYKGERKPFYRVHFESLFGFIDLYLCMSLYVVITFGSVCFLLKNHPIGNTYANSLNKIGNSFILTCLTSDSV